MAALYLISRCIWLPMLVHALIDLTSGAIGYHVLKQGSSPASDPLPPAHQGAQPNAATG